MSLKIMALFVLAQGCTSPETKVIFNLGTNSSEEKVFHCPKGNIPYGVQVSLKGKVNSLVTLEIPGKPLIEIKGSINTSYDLGDWYDNQCTVRIKNPEKTNGKLEVRVRFFTL